MAKVIIFGDSCFSTCLHKTLSIEQKHEVVGYTLSKAYIKDYYLESLPVVPFEELEEHFDMSKCEIALTIGYKKLNDNRALFYQRCKQLGYKIFTYISPSAMVYSNDIGEGSLVYPGVYIGPYVSIGKCNVVHMNVCISHHISINDFNYFAAGTIIGGNVSVGSNCFIGMNSTIKNGLSIGNRVLLGAHSFLSKKAEDGLAYMGNPAESKKGMTSDFLIKFLQ